MQNPGTAPCSDHRWHPLLDPVCNVQRPVLPLRGMGSGDGRRISRQVPHGGGNHTPDVLGDLAFIGTFRQLCDHCEVRCLGLIGDCLQCRFSFLNW